MAAESLREELMALAGVAEAEVDEAADSPSGVRVRLEPDADARLVGAEVQRVLAAHGLRSRITAQDDPDHGEVAAAIPDSPPVDAGETAPELPAAPEPKAAIPPPEPPPDPMPIIPPPPAMPPPMAPPPVAAPVAATPAAPAAGLMSVTVEESRDGLKVVATAADGRTVTQQAEPTELGMYQAVASAVGTLAEGTPPALISVAPLDANGSQAFTVVLERADGTKSAGAAVVRVGSAYAIGRATWAALHEV